MIESLMDVSILLPQNEVESLHTEQRSTPTIFKFVDAHVSILVSKEMQNIYSNRKLFNS